MIVEENLGDAVRSVYMQNQDIEIAEKLAADVNANQGRAYYVGGFVRDSILGRENKDIDLEIHGIKPVLLEHLLSKYGDVNLVGKSFGVYKLGNLDIALPRREKKDGYGHTGFSVETDPYMSTTEACRRRDFTMNAVMQDVLSGEYVDPYDGIFDIQSGIIRHVDDDSFVEDSLRVFRAAQFAARFGFMIAPDTMELCKKVDVRDLPIERIKYETDKALLKSDKPSVYFQILDRMGNLDVYFPEIKALQGVKQRSDYHPEGDAYVHTMKVLDKAAGFRDMVWNQTGYMYAALYHDIGKALMTKFSEKKGIWQSPGHEKAGAEMVYDAVNHISRDHNLIGYVRNMVALHGYVALFDVATEPKQMNTVFDQSVAPDELFYLGMADKAGGVGVSEKEIAVLWKHWTECEAHYHEQMSKSIMGRDLKEVGIKPGPAYGEFLKLQHKWCVQENPIVDLPVREQIIKAGYGKILAMDSRVKRVEIAEQVNDVVATQKSENTKSFE